MSSQNGLGWRVDSKSLGVTAEWKKKKLELTDWTLVFDIGVRKWRPVTANNQREGKTEMKRKEEDNRALIWCRSCTAVLRCFRWSRVKMWKTEGKKTPEITPLPRNLFWEASVGMNRGERKAEDWHISHSKATRKTAGLLSGFFDSYYLFPSYYHCSRFHEKVLNLLQTSLASKTLSLSRTTATWLHKRDATESLLHLVCQMLTSASRLVFSPLQSPAVLTGNDGELTPLGAACWRDRLSPHLHPHWIKPAHDAWGERTAAADLPSLSDPTSRKAPPTLLKSPCTRKLLLPPSHQDHPKGWLEVVLLRCLVHFSSFFLISPMQMK